MTALPQGRGDRLNHVSLFTGIGGADLAAEWAGFETVLQCEIDPDCQKVLRKHWPDVTLVEDVRNVTREVVAHAESLRRHDGATENHRTTAGKVNPPCDQAYVREGRITLLTAGVPCQPASVAGKRRGKADDRWLWPEAIRVLSELQPSWAVFENPAGIGSLGELGGLSEVGEDLLETLSDREAVELDNICRDIEKNGYEVQPVCIPACAVGAPHRRDRIFIIAHAARGFGESRGSRSIEWGTQERDTVAADTPSLGRERGGRAWDGRDRPQNSGEVNPDSRCVRSEAGLPESEQRQERDSGEPYHGISERDWWSEDWLTAATRLCGIHDGLPHRVDRIRMLGNAIVPAQIYPVLQAIMRSLKEE